MKLKKLFIENIASIERAEVDFENGVLAEEPLFLICGNTGAGKSTLLDAICLALYNNTPRLSNANKENYVDTELVTTGDRMLSNNDVRQLLRRNAVKGSVVLDFEGNDGVGYTATWSVARARLNANGNLQGETVSLLNHRTGKTLTKKNEIKTAVQQCVGLTFEQFCRTTLLAQGAFTEFLQSKEAGKAEILEKLTGTEIYSRIGATIFQINKEKEEAYQAKKQRIDAVRLLTDEEKNAIGETIAQHESTVKELSGQKESILKKRQWTEESDKRRKAVNEAAAQLEKAQAGIGSPEYKERAATVTHWENTADARAELLALQQTETELKALEVTVRELKSSYATLTAGRLWMERDLQHQREQQALIRTWLNERMPHRDMLKAGAEIATLLETATTAKSNAMAYRNNITRLTDSLKKAEETRLLKEKEWETDKKRLEQTARQLTEQMEKAEAANAPRLQAELEKESGRLATLEEAQRAFERWQDDNVILTQKEKNTDRTRQELEGQTAVLARLEKEMAAAATARDAAQQLYDRQKDSLDNWAKDVRRRLQAGDRCPVCGKTVETVLHDADFEKLIQPVVADLNEKTRQFESIKDSHAVAQAYVGRLTQELRKATEELNALRPANASLRNTATEKCRAAGIDPEAASHELLKDKELQLKKTQAELNRQLQQALELTKEMNRISREKDNCDKAEKQTHAAFDEACRAVETVKKEMEQSEKMAGNELERARQTFASVAPRLTWEGWAEEWKADSTAFVGRLRKETETYNSYTERLTEIDSRIQVTERDMEAVNGNAAEVAKVFTEQPVTSPAEIQNLTTRWNELHLNVQLYLQHRNSLTEKAKSLSASLAAYCSRHPETGRPQLEALARLTAENIGTLRRQNELLTEELTKALTRFEAENAQFDQHSAMKPEMEESDTMEKLQADLEQTEAQIAAANQQIGEAKSKLADDERRKKESEMERTELEVLEKDFDRWSVFCKNFGCATGAKFRSIAQSFVLKELLHHANSYLDQLTSRYTLECQAGTLSILLRDLYQGGTLRPATTLSGGESFLVSLALALGLSSLSSSALHVDTLFIDEGFGTLSKEYLDTVTDTLERLHRLGGRKVGIISHVEGLRERIRAQIQVVPTKGSKSEVNVVKI